MLHSTHSQTWLRETQTCLWGTTVVQIFKKLEFALACLWGLVLAILRQNLVKDTYSHVTVGKQVVQSLQSLAQLLVTKGKVHKVTACDGCCHELNNCLQLWVPTKGTATPVARGNG